MKKVNTLLLVVFSLFLNARSTKGKEFWIGFMENISLSFNGIPVFKIHVNSDVTTTCTLTVPFTGYSSVFTVNANQVTVLTLPSGNFNPLGDEAIANNGVCILANDSVEVRAFHHRIYFTESTMILPIHELGAEYMVMAVTDNTSNSPGEFVVVATQNSTVEIIPSVTTVGTRPAGVAFTVALSKGQMFQLQAYGDLTGTTVRSLDPNRKIAVFGGARQANVGCNFGADDHVYDQGFPITSLGKNYHVVPFSGHVFDVIKVAASQNSTTVTVSGVGTYTLNKGQSVTFTTSVSCEINANNSIAVSQIATSQGCNGSQQSAKGDPGMINLVPMELTHHKTVFYTTASMKLGPVSEYYSLYRLNVVIKTSAIGKLFLDNVAVSSTSFSPITSTSSYSYVRLLLDTLTTLQHTLSCDSGFNATLYSFPDYNFIGHHLGYNGPSVPLTTTGLKNHESNTGLVFYPNPVENRLSILAEEHIHSILIYDITGKTVLKREGVVEQANNIDLSDLPPGVYFCKVSYLDSFRTAQTFKFIKVDSSSD